MAELSHRKGPTKDDLRKCLVVGEVWSHMSLLCCVNFLSALLFFPIAVVANRKKKCSLNSLHYRADFDDDEGGKFRYFCLLFFLFR